MPPKKSNTSTSTSTRKGCWCGGPESKLEIECSNCRSWIHYLCAGITLPELNAAIHEQPGIYLCKLCTTALDFAEIQSNLKAIYNDCEIFQYNSEICALMNLDASSLIAINQSKTLSNEIQEVREVSQEL
jgi:hypothetical protein